MASSLLVEQVDTALTQLAAICRFSSPKVRASKDINGPNHQRDILKPILLRCTSREMKWVLRIIFKRLGPLQLNETLVVRNIHPMLPSILKVHSDFAAALEVLSSPRLASYSHGTSSLSSLPPELLQTCLTPQTGVKVGRPDFLKVRSLQHCLQLVGSRDICISPKYDGEYCQIHVDLGRGLDCIQIFSKVARTQ